MTKVTCRLTLPETMLDLRVWTTFILYHCFVLERAVLQVVCDGFLLDQNADSLSSLSVRHCDVAVHHFRNLCVHYSTAVRFV